MDDLQQRLLLERIIFKMTESIDLSEDEKEIIKRTIKSRELDRNIE